MAYKEFTAGQEALAADVNSLYMQQVVARFPTAATRAAAIASPVLNQLSMTDDRPGVTQYWNGTAWADIGDAWKAYTPSFNGDSGASSIGNGILTGKYYKVGRMVTGNLYLRIGSTTSLNAGAIRLGLPLQIAGAMPDPPVLGIAGCLLANGYWSIGYPIPSSFTQVVIQGPYIVSNGNVAIYNNGNINGAGNFINATFTYETA